MHKGIVSTSMAIDHTVDSVNGVSIVSVRFSFVKREIRVQFISCLRMFSGFAKARFHFLLHFSDPKRPSFLCKLE